VGKANKRAQVLDFAEARKVNESTHPLLGAIVVIEVVSHGVTEHGNRPLVDSDVFIATEPLYGKERAGSLISFWWKGHAARQLSSLEPGQIIVAKVIGTWMENLGTTRIGIDATGITPDERDAALDAWEAHSE
jgi:hypothetical protein